MDRKNSFSVLMIIIPWLTVPFIGKNAFFRFLPVASFINLFISVLSIFANKRRWWINKNPLSPGNVDFSYILGPYYVQHFGYLNYHLGIFQNT